MPDVGEMKLAFDGTVRSVDKDGRLHFSKTHISKATVNGYYGAEIPNARQLGLDPLKIYYLLRDPVELARAASTFARLPILSKHIPISADAHASEFVVGTIGSDVEFNDPYLDADVCIWKNDAIAGIETEVVRQFSAAYRYTADMTPGEFHGQRYDGVMREIHGNHLALVETGRAGSDVLAADEELMKTTKLGKALVITLGGMSPKLAQDSLLKLVGEASGKTLNVGEVSTALIAMDAELDPKQIKTTVDALIALDMSSGPGPMGGGGQTAEDSEDDEDEKKKAAKDKKIAKDAEEKDEKDEKDKKAMDSAIDSRVAVIRRDLQEAQSARLAVREVVGEVIAQDSAEEIYAFALDTLEVDHKDVTELPALKALFKVAHSVKSAAPVAVAMDSAGLAAQFPEAARFRQM